MDGFCTGKKLLEEHDTGSLENARYKGGTDYIKK